MQKVILTALAKARPVILTLSELSEATGEGDRRRLTGHLKSAVDDGLIQRTCCDITHEVAYKITDKGLAA